MSVTKRDSSIDILKIFAAFCVVSVHFFLNNGFYTYPVKGPAMFTAVTIRTFFMVCVPLFMIVTGHLMCKKTLSGSYYKGIIKIYAIYVLASIAHIIYKNAALDTGYTFGESIRDILNFKAANYSWYVEMYLGLFLIIPFLNLAYNGLTTKKHKQILVITFLCIVSLPTIANTFVLTEPGWWSNPSSSTEYTQIVPSWWLNLHPVMYYFIGCYLREYRLSFNKVKCFFILAGTVLVAGGYNYYRSCGTVFQSGKWADWDSPFTILSAVMVYILLTDLKCAKNFSSTTKSVLKYLSELTLGIYLVSYIFDNMFYKKLISAIPEMPDRLPYYFIMVPVVFICSLILAAILDLIYKVLCIIGTAIGSVFK